MGNDDDISISIRLIYRFQSTFPRGERLCHQCSIIPALQFQSTFPRGERPSSWRKWTRNTGFQSTFPRGERLIIRLIVNQKMYFNPRSRVGNDGFSFFIFISSDIISIHVPAWGTTTLSRFWFIY